MNDAHTVRDGAFDRGGPEVARPPKCDDCASRAADMSADLYAHGERSRRHESLEELLGRERHA